MSPQPKGEKLHRFLARCGVASRRCAERWIEEGRVRVNGEIADRQGIRIVPGRDQVEVDGRIVRPVQPVYLLLYKPKGVLTTVKDPKGRRTVLDLVPRYKGLFPVGRLDFATEGLLLITNDGLLAHRLLHPRYEVPRIYEVKVERILRSTEIDRIERGIRLDGTFVRPSAVSMIRKGKNHCWVRLVVHEGRHHEVRRLFKKIGHPVVHLRRVGFASLNLRGLRPGQYRPLTPEEITQLRKDQKKLTS